MAVFRSQTNNEDMKASIDLIKQARENNADIAILKSSLADIATINVKSFGVKGDGTTDDTVNLQTAFTAAEGKRLEIPSNFNCKVTSQITMPSNIIINCKGQFTCTGDSDYWFYSDSPNRVVVEQFKTTVTLTFSSRTKLNRVLVCNNPTYFEVKNAEITGASTAIHSINGDTFVAGDIRLKNVYGTEAQYGYGVNTSAVNSTIKSLKVDNDDSAHGRHAIYINGGQWKNVSIGYVYVNNFARNPINIINTTPGIKSYLCIGTAVFINTNLNPTTDTTGSIHVGDENTAGVRVQIDSVRINGTAGTVVGSQGSNDAMYIGSVYAENILPAVFVNTHLINLRFGNNRRVGKVFCTALNTNWLSGVYLRDTNNAIVDDVYVGGSGASYQAIRLSTATVTLGNIQTESITRIFNSGSTVKNKYLTTGTRTFSSGGSSTTVTITHGLGTTPSYWNVQKAISGLPVIDYVTADATTLTVNFVSAPPAGTNNVVLKWAAQI